MVTVFGQIDTGELAVRLGSIVSFDRRGNVIWMDDFEEAFLNWAVTAGGGGGKASLNMTASLSGSQSCLVQSGTTTEDPTKIIRGLAFPVLGRMGFEIANSYHSLINILTWRIVIYDGSTLHVAKIYWHNGLDRLYYVDHENNPQVLATGVDLSQLAHGFNVVKLVCDFLTGEYVRLICNGKTIDMSGLRYYQTSLTAYSRMLVEFWVDGVTAQDAAVYVDNVIVTQNEP